MKIFRELEESWFKWLEGSPPMSEDVIQTIHDEFHVLLYVGCCFLHVKYWKFNVFIVIFLMFVLASYLFCLGGTAVRQMDDFVTASQSIHMFTLDILAMTMIICTNLNRHNLINIFRSMSVSFYDYQDGFEITEMKEEFKRSRKLKLFTLTAVPTYLVMTALCCILGRTIDTYFGVATEEDYVNEVYMKVPIPMWYPITPNGPVMHYFLVFTQAMGANALAVAVAGSDALLIFVCQSFQLQFKIIKYRLRKIEECAYYNHRVEGGEELQPGEMFSNPSFLRCYHTCLKKIAHHHSIMIENYFRLRDTVIWAAGVAVVLGSLLIAMSLLAIILGGGKPSIMMLAVMLVVAEILNMAMISSQSEVLKEAGEALHEELYDLNWPDTNTSIKRTIMIIIERSKRPLVLEAGLTPLSWETFSAIMNTAYSYVNLLIATVNSDR